MRGDRTYHAQQRIQQRGISELQVELLRLFGEDFYQKGGATLTRIPTKRLKQLRKAIDNLDKVAVVKGEEDRVLTVIHQTKRIHTTNLCA